MIGKIKMKDSFYGKIIKACETMSGYDGNRIRMVEHVEIVYIWKDLSG